MLQITSLSKSFGPQSLFENVTLQLNTGCRYGLVGANGAGKTTLLKILIGEEAASSGEVMIPKGTRVGVLKQDRFMNDAQRVLDLAMMGDERVYAALTEYEQVSHSEHPDAERLAALEEQIQAFDGYTLESRASTVLLGLGVPLAQVRAPLSQLSGGFKLRVLLAQVLIGAPEILLLDEPTNHLDILSIRWLEDFLRNYEGCAVVISHDVQFLDRVATHMLDVDYKTVTAYVGNYHAFVAQKALVREQKEAEIARVEKILAEKRAFVERFKAKATKARQAQSRAKQIEKIEVEVLPETSRRAPLFDFKQVRQSGRDVLSVEGVSKSFGEKHVLKGIGLNLRRGERLGVIGANGLGKSTLLKLLTERLQPDQGKIQWGHEVRIGYFAQDHKELLSDPKLTTLDFVWNACPDQGTAFVRGRLGRMLFSGDTVEKSVASLSGGEGARLIFCRMMVEQPNVLVLDEPTNHLDIEAIEALVKALQAFEGTTIFVSHDRWFVSQLATRVLEITPQGVNEFPGTYDEYLQSQGQDHLDRAQVAAQAKQDQRAKKEEQKEQKGRTELGWEERKRLQNKLKSLPKRRDELLQQISNLETRLSEIHGAYAGLYERNDIEAVQKLQREEQGIKDRIVVFTSEWEQVEGELEELGALVG
ncbi:MAG TPA: ATP-binding cassette domain-containing protein [Polyangiaceae bacterium]|jgi:ATPase subunit of ABC transporter with duplicated ATPase domains|nr:ATP-binding cassette domain-containing protein [Polyangiaceae bacterium]